MIFERSTSGQLPSWYHEGKEGMLTSQVDEPHLPVRFITSSSHEAGLPVSGCGKPLMVSFNTCVHPGRQVGYITMSHVL